VKFTAGGFAVEIPVDRDPVAVHTPLPGDGLLAQRRQVPDPAFANALPCEQANLKLGRA